MKHEKPPPLLPSTPLACFVSAASTYFATPSRFRSRDCPILPSPLLSAVPAVPTSNFECITGPPTNPLALPVSGQMEI